MPLFTMNVAADWLVFNVNFTSSATPVSLLSLLSVGQLALLNTVSGVAGIGSGTQKRVVMNVTLRPGGTATSINVSSDATSGATWNVTKGTQEDYPVEGGLDKIFIVTGQAATAGSLELKVFLEASL